MLPTSWLLNTRISGVFRVTGTLVSRSPSKAGSVPSDLARVAEQADAEGLNPSAA